MASEEGKRPGVASEETHGKVMHGINCGKRREIRLNDNQKRTEMGLFRIRRQVDFRWQALAPQKRGLLFCLNSMILYAVNFTLYNRQVHKREGIA